MKTVDELFDVKYGHNYELMHLKEGAIPFVSRSDKNNGISGYVAHTGEDPSPAGCITVALGGSVMSAFVQPRPCYEGRDIATLIAKSPEMSLQEKYWYCAALKRYRPLFSYGRQANRFIHKLKLPPPPANIDSYEIPDLSWVKQPAQPQTQDPNTWNYKIFQLHDLFKLEKGKSPDLFWAQNNPGKVHFVSASSQNQGVTASCAEHPDFKLQEPGCLTISTDGSVLETFYRTKPFYALCNVLIARAKGDVKPSRAALLYVSAVIMRHKFRFNYGRKFTGDRTNLTLKLPCDRNGQPDWQAMNDYVLGLPNSVGIKD